MRTCHLVSDLGRVTLPLALVFILKMSFFMVAGPVLVARLLSVEGGAAETQAGFLSCTDPSWPHGLVSSDLDFCRRGHTVLKIHLPAKEENVILVRLSKIQRDLYTQFMDRFRDCGSSGWLGLNPLKAFCVCCKVC